MIRSQGTSHNIQGIRVTVEQGEDTIKKLEKIGVTQRKNAVKRRKGTRCGILWNENGQETYDQNTGSAGVHLQKLSKTQGLSCTEGKKHCKSRRIYNDTYFISDVDCFLGLTLRCFSTFYRYSLSLFHFRCKWLFFPICSIFILFDVNSKVFKYFAKGNLMTPCLANLWKPNEMFRKEMTNYGSVMQRWAYDT